MTTVKANSRFVTIKLTHEEVSQLRCVIGQGYGDGDHVEWLKSAGESAKGIRAFYSAMEKIHIASSLNKNT